MGGKRTNPAPGHRACGGVRRSAPVERGGDRAARQHARSARRGEPGDRGSEPCAAGLCAGETLAARAGTVPAAERTTDREWPVETRSDLAALPAAHLTTVQGKIRWQFIDLKRSVSHREHRV